MDCSPDAIQNIANEIDPDCEVFAEVLPEDKYKLVQAFQRAGHTVGMTGDGVNDAPALRQAEVGIAVSNATDVAKAAASLVLTNAGLGNIISAVEVSRQIYQRMLTYTLNKIIKTIVIALFMSLSLIIARTFVTTSLLIILLLFTNDFVTMSIATDRVRYSKKPNRWQIKTLVMAAMGLAIPLLALLFGFFWFGSAELKLSLGQLQTMLFLALVFSGQGTVYLVRERRHFWSSTPGIVDDAGFNFGFYPGWFSGEPGYSDGSHLAKPGFVYPGDYPIVSGVIGFLESASCSAIFKNRISGRG